MCCRYLHFIISIYLILNTGAVISVPSDLKKNLEKDSSGKDHFGAGEHNRDYDHEAFLGEQAKEFDNLSPEESTKRLGLIVDKIDKDSDGYITLDELKNWITYTQNRYLVNDIESQWRTYKLDPNGSLTWEMYRMTVYGISDEREVEDLDKEEESGYSYKKMLSRDKRRWNLADGDGNRVLNRDEFAAFLHPEEHPHMRDIVVIETIEDIDKDGDGKITVEEYISDIFPGDVGSNPDEEEPDWVQTEREQFKLYRDKNGDGIMDEHEIKDWLLPTDFDHADSEARHLIHEADSDSDEKLTKDEILQKYDLFVGSQATDFGEALIRHDEF